MQDGDGQVRRSSKAVQPDVIPGLDSRHPKTAKTDDTGAEERRRAKIIESCRKWNNEIAARAGEFGVAAVDGVASEGGRVTEILMTLEAIPAGSIGAADPGDAHPGTHGKCGRGSACNLTDDLVAGNQWLEPGRQFAFDNMQVGPANTTGTHLDQNVTGQRFGLGDLNDFQGAKRDASW
jgi:hypothetical protein